MASNGTTFTEKYHQPVSATDNIKAFITVEKSHIVISKATKVDSNTDNATSVEEPTAGQVIRTEYYTLSGTKASSVYNELETGIYIQKDIYESGKVINNQNLQGKNIVHLK